MSDATEETTPRRTRRSERRQRSPLGGMRQKLGVPNHVIPPGYVARWVNDEGGRVLDAQNAGYEFVTTDTQSGMHSDAPGTRVARRVGSHEDGTPMVSYLMLQSADYYAEDQQVKQQEIDKIDDSIRRAKPRVEGAEDERFYGSAKLSSNRA